jgi:hypothetical protein
LLVSDHVIFQLNPSPKCGFCGHGFDPNEVIMEIRKKWLEGRLASAHANYVVNDLVKKIRRGEVKISFLLLREYYKNAGQMSSWRFSGYVDAYCPKCNRTTRIFVDAEPQFPPESLSPDDVLSCEWDPAYEAEVKMQTGATREELLRAREILRKMPRELRIENRSAEAEYLVRALTGVSFDEFVAARERLAAYYNYWRFGAAKTK